jgi:DNA gyrase subunit B
MNPRELWETTMNPENRTLKQIEIRDALEADEVFSTLMGNDVALRRNFIWENSDKITSLDI